MIQLKYITLFWIASAFVMALAGCTSKNKPRTLTVSIEPQRFLLEQIVGDRWQVNTLLENGADPENFDPPMSVLKKALDSKAILIISQLPFEESLTERLGAKAAGIKIYNTSRGIDLLSGTHGSHGHSHQHEDFDPHVWSSVVNAKIMADNMLAAILEIDPDGAAYYTANHKALMQRLDALQSELMETLKENPGASFIVWHPSLSYFARDFGLNQISLGAENKELTAPQMREKIEQARTAGANVMFIQASLDRDKSQQLASQAGAHSVTINPLAYEWDDELRLVANSIAGLSPDHMPENP